jgi:anti-sigma regulatory factor (Ser/Thr protein kinase)
VIAVSTFPNAAVSVSRARHLAHDALGAVPREIRDSVELLISELATNCVRHTSSDFVVSIDVSGDRIRVDVTDRGSGQPQVKSPPPSSPSGRGLRIVDLLADRWGVYADDRSGAKTVWFEILISGRSSVVL